MDPNGRESPEGSDPTVMEHHHTVRPVNRHVELSERRFDVNTLPADMRRVYGHLAKKFGEEYGLLFVFTMRTAVELHRAWHMTLLTSNILQQIKDEFDLRYVNLLVNCWFVCIVGLTKECFPNVLSHLK